MGSTRVSPSNQPSGHQSSACGQTGKLTSSDYQGSCPGLATRCVVEITPIPHARGQRIQPTRELQSARHQPAPARAATNPTRWPPGGPLSQPPCCACVFKL